MERTELAKSKTGVFTGNLAVNPVTGEPVPIWVADYVLGSYGTGAVMAVPAHDKRDHEFAVQFGLPVKRVVEGGELPYVDEGVATNSASSESWSSENGYYNTQPLCHPCCKAFVVKARLSGSRAGTRF